MKGHIEQVSEVEQPNFQDKFAKIEPLQIVHVEDDLMDAAMVVALLESEGICCKVKHVCGRHEFKAALAEEKVDLILSDFSMPRFDGLSALEIARKLRPEIPFIFISGTIGEELAVHALKEGASDYVLKDRPARLPEAVRRAINDARIGRERRLVEDTLLESQERLNRAEMFSHLMVTHVGLDGQWLKVPPLLCSLLGYGEAELLKLKIQDISGPHDSDADWGQYRMLLQGGLKSFSSDKRYRHKNGATLWMSVSTTVVLDKEGKPVHFLTYLRDITTSVLAHENIRAQAELLNMTKDAIWVCNFTGEILFWNKGAEDLYGWTGNEIIGRRAGQILYRGRDMPMTSCLNETQQTGYWHGEVSRICKNEKNVIVQSRCQLLCESAFTKGSILVVETDITEKKRLEDEMLRHQRIQTIGALTGGIVHDLNHALAPLMMGVSLLRQEPISLEGVKLLNVMDQSARRGAEMVKQILSFARGVGGQQAAVDLKEMTENIIELAKKTFPASVRIQASFPQDIPAVMGNPTQLEQVLLNLVVNARDAMPQGGLIGIEIKNAKMNSDEIPAGQGLNPGNYVSLVVKDTGHGIEPDLLDRIFRSFFTTKPNGQGTGLGLSTVLGIVKTHGGFLKVSSEVGQGSSFEVYLPAMEISLVQSSAFGQGML